MKSKVLGVKQSPLNAVRWRLDLECGHEKWVTSRRRPTRKWDHCDACSSGKAIRSAPERKVGS